MVDEKFLTNELSLQGNLDLLVDYSSCTYDLLPLFEIDAQFDDDSSARLLERFAPVTDLVQTGPASLIEATVNLRGAEHTVSDYYRLVYSADRHNLNPRYWVVFDPPIQVAGLATPVHVFEVIAPEPDPIFNTPGCLGVPIFVRDLPI